MSDDSDYLVLPSGVVDMRRIRLVGLRLALDYALHSDDPDEMDRARTAALEQVGEGEFGLVVDHALTVMTLHIVREILKEAGANRRETLGAELEQLRRAADGEPQ